MSLHNGHRKRHRDKYMKYGMDVFSDHELLEFLLFYCYPRGDTNAKAHRMINEFGGLASLLESSTEEVMNRCGVTERVATLVTMIPSLAKRYSMVKWAKRSMLDSVQKAGEYAKTLFIGKTTEHFYLICLDAQRQLICPALVAEGSLTDIAIYPRKILEEALKYRACFVILTHNHPSGKIKPSRDDDNATYVIGHALEPLDIGLLDHIVVGGEKYYSYSEHGKLDTAY